MATDVRGLADTNVIIHLPRLSGDALPREVLISAVTLAELSAGPHQTDDPAERGRRTALVQRIESMFFPLPFDDEAARHYGALVAGVVAVGRKPRRREADLMIAGIAAANGLPLYTTNPNDFAGLAGIVRVVALDRSQ